MATERPFSGPLPPHTRPSILMHEMCMLMTANEAADTTNSEKKNPFGGDQLANLSHKQ